jgi:anoctamin-10
MSIFLAKYTGPGTHISYLPLTYQLLRAYRVRDWIHGVRTAAPSQVTRESLEAEPLYEAERLRIIYQLITNPASEGGAGITPKEGEWVNVESIFALHDHAYNKDWIKKWSSQYILKTEDLDDIRNRLGEKVSLYCPFSDGHGLTV